MKKVLVSACLLGQNCKYSGGNNRNEKVLAFVKDKEVIPVCPELEAGLGVPRNPVEIVGGHLQDRQGNSVDEAVRKTVEAILGRLADEEIACAVLQSRSPTCGCKQVYDGTFSKTLIPGAGVFAQALMDAGIPVTDSGDL